MGHILVIASDEGLEGFVRRMFAVSYTVSRVESTGSAAAKIAAGERFDALICDVPSGPWFRALDWIDAKHAPKVVVLLRSDAYSLVAFYGVTLREPIAVDRLRLAIQEVLTRPWGP